MNIDIPNLEENIDVEFVENWVQLLEFYFAVNQLSEAENITIVSLNMSSFVRYWWDNLWTKMEKEEEPLYTWVKFVEYV